MYKGKTIFIAPLDWGLGHATRCVPLIKQLMADNVVFLGVSGATRLIFEEEFPGLQKIDIEPYDIRYSKLIPLTAKLLCDAPKILKVIKKEQAQLQQIVEDHHIDLIISDNRFGLYHDTVETIYITHQLNIKAGVWSSLATKIHRHYIRRFTNIWVPDFEDSQHSLAGDLSRNSGLQSVEYIGPLSRLHPDIEKTDSLDYLVMLSGVEPQRSLLEEKLMASFRNTDKKVCLVRGTNKPSGTKPSENLTVLDLPDVRQLSQLLRNAKTVICRSGYSTLMDLHAFDKKDLILIPTPGQTEQLYLASYWKEKYGAKVLEQAGLSSWKP